VLGAGAAGDDAAAESEPDEALAVDELLSADELFSVVDDEAAEPPDLPPLLLRKSVTYQPDPLSWKPAAVNCLENAACPHWGQSVNGASASFCNTSCWCPQALQL